MTTFETILVLLLGATLLSSVGRRLNVPYPTLLALGGAAVAFLPGAPQLDMPSEMIFALFVAPVLLDAAYDSSLRDLKIHWLPVLSLILVAVALTTVAVAAVARLAFPDLPWAAAIALGALLAPPDAVSALAVLRQVNPPHRIRMILEGESLLNDASALLIYKLAIGAVATRSFGVTDVLPAFALVVFGSTIVGWAVAWPASLVAARFDEAASSVIFQFVITFGLWIIADRIGLSSIVTVVVFGFVSAHRSNLRMPARLRVPSFAIWEAVTVVLNVLAFTLIGLQIGPILAGLQRGDLETYLLASLAILATTIVVRMLWVITHQTLDAVARRLLKISHGSASSTRSSFKSGLAIGWSGMRGIITIAAAVGLPADFPHRDFMQLAAFVVVLGTLVIQGLTLGPLIKRLHLPEDDLVDRETHLARKQILKSVLAILEGDETPAAKRLLQEYQEVLNRVRSGKDPRATRANSLRLRAVECSRGTLWDLRVKGIIGDDAYRAVEEELDQLELSAGSIDD